MRIKNKEAIDEKRNEIIRCAKIIIQEEGVAALSIRKIAGMLSQTPGIIYHYFENKDAILTAIISQGYMDILATIIKYKDIQDCAENISKTLCAYMHLMCEKGTLFPLLMSSQDPIIRAQIEILSPHACKRKSILYLYNKITEGVQANVFVCEDVVLKTQWIWASTYGVISTILHESANETVKDNIIQEHVNSIMKSLER